VVGGGGTLRSLGEGAQEVVAATARNTFGADDIAHGAHVHKGDVEREEQVKGCTVGQYVQQRWC
jgi:hypothetical protein